MTLKNVKALIDTLPKNAMSDVSREPIRVARAIDIILQLYREATGYKSLTDNDRQTLRQRLLQVAPQADALAQLPWLKPWQRAKDVDRFNSLAEQFGMSPQELQQHCINTKGQ